jgi:hypothetical protein
VPGGGRSLERVQDRQALPDQAGDDLVDALGAVEDGEVGLRDAIGRGPDQRGKRLNDPVGGDEFLVAALERTGPRGVGIGVCAGLRAF